MELQFRKREVGCLKRLNWDCTLQEQTQELRLSDGLPDIGRVLCAWGQVVIRSKQWGSATAEVSGGVMAWVLCKAEDTQELFCVDSWIPFRTRMDLPESERDGTLLVCPVLNCVEARSLSARKLMIRACVHLAVDAVVPDKLSMYEPEDLPEDVCILEEKLSACLPVEAGEKPFLIEDVLQLPDGSEQTKILRYSLTPEVSEKRVVGGKVVFRGSAKLYVLYCTPEGELKHHCFDQPFSQLAELERDYEESADVCIFPAVTGLELDVTADGSLDLKASLTGQYLITDTVEVSTVADAYSPVRQTEAVEQPVLMPTVADLYEESISAEAFSDTEVKEILDAELYLSHPILSGSGESAAMNLEGNFLLLYKDGEGNAQSMLLPWQKQIQYPMPEEGNLMAVSIPAATVKGELSGRPEVKAKFEIQVTVAQELSRNTLSELRLGEQKMLDPSRPSVILCRPAGKSLWQLAKGMGSTVESIVAANGIVGQPDENQLLLIPIL